MFLFLVFRALFECKCIGRKDISLQYSHCIVSAIMLVAICIKAFTNTRKKLVKRFCLIAEGIIYI